jgi:hypothetical protein
LWKVRDGLIQGARIKRLEKEFGVVGIINIVVMSQPQNVLNNNISKPYE